MIQLVDLYSTHGVEISAELIIAGALRKGSLASKSLGLLHQIVMQVVPQNKIEQNRLAHFIMVQTTRSIKCQKSGTDLFQLTKQSNKLLRY